MPSWCRTSYCAVTRRHSLLSHNQSSCCFPSAYYPLPLRPCSYLLAPLSSTTVSRGVFSAVGKPHRSSPVTVWEMEPSTVESSARVGSSAAVAHLWYHGSSTATGHVRMSSSAEGRRTSTVGSGLQDSACVLIVSAGGSATRMCCVCAHTCFAGRKRIPVSACTPYLRAQPCLCVHALAAPL